MRTRRLLPSRQSSTSGPTRSPSRQRCPRFAATPEVQTALNKQVHTGPASTRAGTSGGAKNHGTPRNHYDRQSVLRSQPKTLRLDREPEADEPNVAATVWLNRVLPDPTPPSRRLKPAFARRLARISARNNVDWALTLAVLRSSGERGAVPAIEGATPDAREGAPCAPLQAQRVDLGALARRPHDVRRPRDRPAAPLSGRRPEGARQGLRLGKAVPLEADPERPSDHDLSGRTI